ncbi:DUF4397 domain-containing protein [Mucilaginibacter sp. HMF5004]|uniref:DUF4397 domain-containing protein n=1 Tax=Mucilaginibacter rivuli TaxID=2857527 RepID=UPI001C5D77C6|nr:DUF4397 domain-containing protein [Mucilaginibacter rivuli]MBW4890879.1 DUF4397 domain-containing protein [Mucilaginibacter rivuli]
MNISYQLSATKGKGGIWLLLTLIAVVVLSSCNPNGSASVSPSSATTKIAVINASPDIGPVTVAIGGGVQIGPFFRYPAASNYYSLSSGPQFFQVRNTKYLTVLTGNDTLAVNTSYSLYVLGINASTASSESLTAMLVADTSSIPTLGSGKIRFVNTSPRTTGLDVTANGTKAFSAIPFKGVSAYQQLPAGIYDFKIFATGASTGVLVDVPLITIQDGRLYTLFTHGLTGRTDTAAIGAAVMINK